MKSNKNYKTESGRKTTVKIREATNRQDNKQENLHMAKKGKSQKKS